jgi:hypothetical protein
MINTSTVKDNEDKDCRALPYNFFKRFLDDEDLGKFVKLVNNHEELELLFRGNSSEEGTAVIYRNNHAMFTIRPDDVEFNPNYLRYDPDWESKLEDLMNLYDKKEKPTLCPVERNTNEKGEHSYSCSFKSKRINATINEDFLNALSHPIAELGSKSLYEFLSEIFDVYFNKTDEMFSKDQFLIWGNKNDSKYKNEVVQVRKKSNYLEKKRQQQLFSVMNDQDDGYYFYDMEFAEKGASSGKKNNPDMQALRFEGGVPKAWVFVEVKSTVGACGGESGLDKHIPRMIDYITDDNKILNRKREALLLFHQYQEIGLFDIKRKIEPSVFDSLNPEIIVIFTDKAKGKWKQYEEMYKNTSVKKVTLGGNEEMALPKDSALLVKNFERSSEDKESDKD